MTEKEQQELMDSFFEPTEDYREMYKHFNGLLKLTKAVLEDPPKSMPQEEIDWIKFEFIPAVMDQVEHYSRAIDSELSAYEAAMGNPE